MASEQTVSRRRFLKTTLGAVAAPYIIPGSALGLNGAIAPSNRITLGMIGTGGMMGGHLRHVLSRKDAQVLAVCDVDRGRRNRAAGQVKKTYAKEAAAGTYKGCGVYNEFERVVERDDIDVCFVATPDHWHVPISLAAVKNGKDVYCEKPLTLTIQEGRILSDGVRRYGRVLQVGSQQRSNGAFRKAAEIVRNGWIGKVHTIYTRLGRFAPPTALPEQPIPDGFDYDRWLGPTPWYPYNKERALGHYGGGWRRFWEYGARKNGDWGAHHYDIIQWALGTELSGPTFFFPVGYEGRKYQGFEYEGGPIIHREHPVPGNHMIHFIGDAGTVSVSRGNKLDTNPGHLKGQPLSHKDVRLYASNSHHNDFFNAVRNRSRPIADVEIGHRTATVCHLSGISERLGRPLKWDPENEQIVGDEEASRWLDRPRRAPYTL